MPQPSENYSVNTLLGAMSADDLDLLKPHFTRVVLEREAELVRANTPIDRIYFPEGGVGSIVSRSAETGSTEVGIFGREGMSGVAALLGAEQSPHDTFMQIGGSTALRIDTDRLLAAVDQSPTLRTMLLRYVQTFIVQGAQSAVSNAHQRIESRLSRWLLMCHDRVDGADLPLTHQFMAMMIAAERSGVTVSLHILEGIGAIRSKRGRVIILDRAQLEDLAGDGYGKAEAEYRRLIGPMGPGAEH